MTQMVHYLRPYIRRGIFMTLDGALSAVSVFIVKYHIPNTHTLSFLYAFLLQRLVNTKTFPNQLEAVKCLVIIKVSHSNKTLDILAANLPVGIVADNNFIAVRINLVKACQVFFILFRNLLQQQVVSLKHQLTQTFAGSSTCLADFVAFSFNVFL